MSIEKLKKEIENLGNIELVPTKYLLSLQKRCRKMKFSFGCSCCGCILDEEKEDYELFSSYEEYLKNELDGREHIETNKLKLKEIRQYCAKHKVSKEEAKKRIL